LLPLSEERERLVQGRIDGVRSVRIDEWDPPIIAEMVPVQGAHLEHILSPIPVVPSRRRLPDPPIDTRHPPVQLRIAVEPIMDPLEALREALWPVLPVLETVRVLCDQPYGDGMTDDDSLLWRCNGSRETGRVGIEVVRVMKVDHDLTFHLHHDLAVLPEMDGPGVILLVLGIEIEDAPHVGQLLAGGLDDLIDRFAVKGRAGTSKGKGLLLRRKQVRMG
jgi:hypothetical protein